MSLVLAESGTRVSETERVVWELATRLPVARFDVRVWLSDSPGVDELAEGLEARGDLHQVDTYFITPRGRLKLRQINQAGGELIYYERLEATATRFSDYFVAPVAVCAAMRDVLIRAYGERVTVEKTRRPYMYRGVRIHIDRIERLRQQIPGLALAGNAFSGIGVPDCVRSGSDAATKILTVLGIAADQPRIAAS